jgi:type IX secretion system PorP/SprF family membrane protein
MTMKNTIKNILIALGTVTAISANAQDVHFSHMEFSPMTLNPGLAGANSPMQGIVNYRSQWNSVAVPYQTIAASFDARFNENKRSKKGIIAGGINFFNDQAGELKVNTNNVNLNLAYHLILDQTSTLGLGIYTGFGQRSISPDGAKWGSQYDYSTLSYNAGLASGETFNSPSFNFLDAGAGIVYTYKDGQGYMTQNAGKLFNWGFAAYHVNRPNYSYLDNGTEKLYIRYSTFVNANIGIQNTKGSILPGIYYNRQGKAQEIFFGMNYKYLLSEGSKVTGFTKPMAMYLGLFSRWGDAMIGKFMFEYDQFTAGFAYDINISSLTEVSRTRGGFELFLRFNMLESKGGFKSRI